MSLNKKELNCVVLSSMFLLILLSYVPTLSGDFILDDFPLVKNNPFIKELHSPLAYLAREDTTPMDRSKDYDSGYYRPLISFLNAVEYKIWGMNPTKFRAVSLALHLLTCLVLYKVLRCFFTSGTGPFWAALFFGIHPANTESVSWIAARNNVAVTLFSLTSLYFYVKRTRDGNKWAGLPCLLALFSALLAKEFAVMLVPIYFLYDWTLGKRRMTDLNVFYGYIAFLIVIAGYFFLRQFGTTSVLKFGDLTHVLKSLYFAPYVILYNLRIIFFPYNLHNLILSHPADLIGWEALAGFVTLGIFAWIVWRQRRNGFILFSSLSFLVALFPVLQIIPTSAVSIVAMRWLYFPMAFLCVAGAWGMERLIVRARRVYGLILLCAGVSYFGSYTFILNENLWKSESVFFRQEVLGFRNSFYLEDLAVIYHSEGRMKESYEYFQMALGEKSRRSFVHLYINYAALLVDLNKPQEALQYLDMAERLKPLWVDQARLYNNRGVAYFKMNDYDRALVSLKKAVAIEQGNKDFLVNLGNTYSALRRHNEAASSYLKSLDLGADPVIVCRMLSRAYFAMDDFKNALMTLQKLPAEVVGSDPELLRMFESAIERASN